MTVTSSQHFMFDSPPDIECRVRTRPMLIAGMVAVSISEAGTTHQDVCLSFKDLNAAKLFAGDLMARLQSLETESNRTANSDAPVGVSS